MATCPACQATVRDTTRFCTACGTSLAGVPRPAEHAPVEAANPFPSPANDDPWADKAALDDPYRLAAFMDAALPGDHTAPAKETDLATMVGAYAVIGGYSAGMVGLFAPVVLLVAFALFGTTDFSDGAMYFIFFVVLGSIIWIPLSVILAVVLGIGGLLLGLVTGIVAAVLFRLTRGQPQLFDAVKVIAAALNALVFGYAAYWLYTHSFFGTFFEELTAAPLLIGIIGALAGFLMALIDPEKSDDATELTDEEAEAAKRLLAAPFRLWGKAAGRVGGTATDIMFDASASIEEQQQKQWRKDMERLDKEHQRRQREEAKAKQEFENRLRRIQEEAGRKPPDLKLPKKKK